MRSLTVACALLALTFACDPSKPNLCKSTPVVQTQNGPVQGYIVEELLREKAEAFLGIPFAEPPVGNNRLRPPKPYSQNWTDVRLVTEHGPICPQVRLTEKGSTFLGEEDCLFINIFRPVGTTPSHRLPVMFWIYGGGYIAGDGHEFGIYDGQHLANDHNVILVSHNYRLNALGFMALESLRAEDPNGTTGNYGVQDQALALKWVHDNIAAFGGDPKRVTIFGESAGGFSVMWHLVSKLSAGLFDAAIMQSGTSDISWFFQNFTEASEFYSDFVAYLGCPNLTGTAELDCLRALPTKDFIIPFSEMFDALIAHIAGLPLPDIIIPFASPLFPLMPFGPVIDGTELGLTATPYEMVVNGDFNKVPLIIGSNKNDGTIFVPVSGVVCPNYTYPVTEKSLFNAFRWFVNSDGNTSIALDLYPRSDYPVELPDDMRLAFALRDVVFECPNRRVANEWAKNNLDVYLYVWTPNLGEIDRLTGLGDFHASELPFVFKTYMAELEAIDPLGGFREVSDIISTLWTNFAHCHNPNGDCESAKENELKLPLWPPYVLPSNATRFRPPFPNASRGNFSNFNANSTRSSPAVDARAFYTIEHSPRVLHLEYNNRHPNDEFASDEKCDFWDQQLFLWHPLRPTVFDKLPFFKN